MRTRDSHFGELEMLRLFKGICLAVREVHHSTPPLAHRDLKLGNVLLSERDQPILMDFGSMDKAVVEITSHHAGQRLQDYAAEHCSMPYRAPELFDVGSLPRVTEKADIWVCSPFSPAAPVPFLLLARSHIADPSTLSLLPLFPPFCFLFCVSLAHNNLCVLSVCGYEWALLNAIVFLDANLIFFFAVAFSCVFSHWVACSMEWHTMQRHLR